MKVARQRAVAISPSCVLTAIVMTVALISVASGPANAGTRWKTGLHVTHTYHWDWPHADSWGGSWCWGAGRDSWADVKRYGDRTYVRDMCKDGKSAVVKVHIFNNDGSIDRKVCRNPYGVKQWAMCDWNWPENNRGRCITPDRCGNMALIAGVYDQDTGKVDWDHGRSIWFSD